MNIFELHFFTNASSLICSYIFEYLHLFIRAYSNLGMFFISEDHYSHFVDVSFGQETLDELTNVCESEFEIPANFDEQVCASWNSEALRGLYHFLYLLCHISE